MFTKCQNNESIRKKLNWIIFGCQWDTRWADPLLKQKQSTNAIEMDYFGGTRNEGSSEEGERNHSQRMYNFGEFIIHELRW